MLTLIEVHTTSDSESVLPHLSDFSPPISNRKFKSPDGIRLDGSGDSFRSNIPVPPPSIPIRSVPTFGRVPPPIPPRLNEIKVPSNNILLNLYHYIQSLVGDTAPAPAAAAAAASAAATSGGDDLGFLDVQVQSAQEVEAEQSQANKMANIMGAFGGMGAPGPAQPPMVKIIIFTCI